MGNMQSVVERVRHVFGNHLDDVRHMIRHDLELLTRSEHPSYLGGLRPALEPRDFDPGRGDAVLRPRRRAAPTQSCDLPPGGIARLLEAGLSACDKLPPDSGGELTNDEWLALQFLLVLYGRPPLPVDQRGELGDIPASWNILADQREEIEIVQRAVGRIELQGHREFAWVGTGFLVSDACLVTTRRVAECFVEHSGSTTWRFRPGISATLSDTWPTAVESQPGQPIRAVIGFHDTYEIAWLEIEPLPEGGAAPWDLDLMVLAAETPDLAGRPVYLIGYPVRDSRHHVSAAVAQMFDNVYGTKCIQPGTTLGAPALDEGGHLLHDCAMIGSAEGSCLVDLETHRVLGLHLTNGYLEPGTAVPLWLLHDDPRMQQSGATYTDSAVSDELVSATLQLRQLARSTSWPEIRDSIRDCYQRSFRGAH